LPQACNHDDAGLPRSTIVGDVRRAEHEAMHDPAGHTKAQILIRTAADRIRSAYLDGSLEPPTAGLVERAFVDLDRLGPAAADYAEDLVEIGALQLVAARAAGGFQAAELQIEYAASVLAADIIRRDRLDTREAVSRA
jgi:hypothetical protein